MRKIPWWTPEAVCFVNNLLIQNKESTVLEFGCGGSTPWLCQRAKKVIAIEHNSRWYHLINKYKISNLDLRLLRRPYNKVCEEFSDNFFDFIMIDGRDRVLCFKSALRVLKSGGWIGLDDSTRAKYAEAFKNIEQWKIIKTKNRDLKKLKTGSRNTWFWQKP